MSGRPRTACGTCQLQKIRCTGEKPTCRRCARLKHSCSYEATPDIVQRGGIERAPQPSPSRPAVAHNTTSTHHLHFGGRNYLGVPRPLILELVGLYYENVSNSSLVLHKTRFLDSVHAGSATPHVLLSVCAWGANFYKDRNGTASLKQDGFMTEWAQQAGRLAFQEIENFNTDLVATFLNLTLFWHSQGSWKVSSLYKANAFHLLCMHGIGDTEQQKKEIFEVEVLRRRFWSWYIMHCHNTEGSGALEPVGDILNLPLPWSEGDFAVEALSSPTVTLATKDGSTSIFAELAKIMTFWSQAVNLIRGPDTSLDSARLTTIYALDEKISLWWRSLPAPLKLRPESFSTVQTIDLPRILLVNLVYHQTLCVLHASLVPLFCWTVGDDGWLSARQFSAQVAYEHACTVSALIGAAIASHSKLSAMPTFVAYAAYGGCAILIPFMWCSNIAVRYQAQASVRTNIRMIHGMADYWKFAALLAVHVNCLYNIHKRNPPALDNEPKYTDVGGLTGFKVDALYARISILEFLGILQKGTSSFAEPGQETTDLGIKQNGASSQPVFPIGATTAAAQLPGPMEASQRTIVPANSSAQSRYERNGLPDLMQSQQWNLLPPSGPGMEMFPPSFVLDNLEPIAGSDIADPLQSDLSHVFFDIDGWDNGPVSMELYD